MIEMGRQKVERIIEDPRRIYLAILSRYARIIGKPIELTVPLTTGSKMQVVLPDTVSTVLAYDGDFEPEVTGFMKQVLKPGDTFFDIGGHFGLRALQALDMGARIVIVFEPGQEQLKYLRKNVADKSNITVEPKAVSDKTGEVLKLTQFGTRYVGSSTLENPRLPNGLMGKALKNAKTVPVETITIDAYVSRSRIVPDVIKIDVENHELGVLKGARETLVNSHPAIIMEVSSIGDDRFRSEECLNLLKSLGYCFYEMGEKEIIPLKGLREEVNNILAVKKQNMSSFRNYT